MADLPAIRPRIPRTLPVPADPDITEAALALYKERVEQVIADTLESIQRKRAFVAFRAEDPEVRMIARSAARLALGLDCNPDREAREAQKQKPACPECRGTGRVVGHANGGGATDGEFAYERPCWSCAPSPAQKDQEAPDGV